ncbi:hypothetical protein Tco_0261398 [Tanacetum coccineum]
MLKYTEKLNEQAKIDNMNNKVKLEESEARFDKWMDSSKNLNKLINSSMSTRSKFGLGYGDTFGSDEVFDLSAPSIFDSCLKDAIEKPLYDGFVKAGGLHAVPGPITGTFMPPSNKPDIDDTQYTYGSKSNNCVETNSVSNDFVSCDNSDKSSDSETTGFASCVSSVKSSSLKTKDQLASASSSVDLKTLHKTDDQGPCNPIFPAGSIEYPTSVPAGRPFPAGLAHIPNGYGLGKDGKLLLRLSIVLGKETRQYMHGGSTNNGGSQQSTYKECLVPSKEFHQPDSSQVVLRVPRRRNLYCFNLTDIHSEREIKCLLAKASLDESTKWHRRMAHCYVPATKESNTRPLTRPSLQSAPFLSLSSYFIWTFLVLLPSEALITSTIPWVLVTRPHNKTPYELLSGKVPNISHLKPFGCHVTILNTSDHLGKFEGKADEGFHVGLYSFQNLMQPAGPRIKLFCHIGEYIRLSRGTSYAQRQVYEANSIAKESW